MRTFKIIVIVLLVVGLALGALSLVAQLISGNDSLPDDFADVYNEEGGQEAINDVYDIQIQKLVGTLRPLGVSIYQEGTHRLEKENKLQALLESTTVDLATYEQKEVEVEGVIRDTTEGNQKIMNVSKVKILDQLVSDKKNFDEIGYGFYFEYPVRWKFKKEVGKVVFYDENDVNELPIISVIQYEHVEQTLREWLDTQELDRATLDAQMSIDGLTAIRRSYKDEDTEVVKTFVQKLKAIYEVRYVGSDDIVKKQYLSILDSFSFTRPEPPTTAEEEQVSTTTGEPSEEMPVATTETPLPKSTEAATTMAPKTTTLAIISSPPATETSTLPLHTLEPLSAAEVERVLEKGYAHFEGRLLSFDYPREWMFTWLGEGHYGFTDYKSYKAKGDEITKSISRLFVEVGELKEKCVYSKTVEQEGTTYIVCAQESGLEEIADHIADSIQVPAKE